MLSSYGGGWFGGVKAVRIVSAPDKPDGFQMPVWTTSFCGRPLNMNVFSEFEVTVPSGLSASLWSRK
jgi:hypothetical protein